MLKEDRADEPAGTGEEGEEGEGEGERTGALDEYVGLDGEGEREGDLR